MEKSEKAVKHLEKNFSEVPAKETVIFVKIFSETC
jgi:hypothetical protein